MPDDPQSPGLRDLNPHGLGEDDQRVRSALLEAAISFGATLEQLEELERDAASKG